MSSEMVERQSSLNRSLINLDVHAPKIEVEIEGEDTRQFRITKVDYQLQKKAKHLKKRVFQPNSSLVHFSEAKNIYGDASEAEIDIFDQASSVEDDVEDETPQPKIQMESSSRFMNEQECYLKKLRNGSTPTCRIFGVYIKRRQNSLCIQVDQQPLPPAYIQELRHPSLSMETDLKQLSLAKLEMNASFVPYFVLNDWLTQLQKKKLPKSSNRNNVSVDITFQKKMRGALLIADVSHFTRLAQNFVRDDFKNVHSLNTRSIASEQLFKFLYQKIFNVLVKLVEIHGGDIVKFVGDSMFVLFPVKQDDNNGFNFEDSSRAVRAALSLALEAFEEFDRKVHFGIGYGSITYNVIGDKRLEGFLSGPGLVDATEAERRSAKYSDNDDYAPLVLSNEATSKISKMDKILRKIFAKVVFTDLGKDADLNKGDFFVVHNNENLRNCINCFRLPKRATAYDIVSGKLKKILHDSRKCDILRSVLALTAPKIVSKYINNAGVSLWAAELRVCTSMFVLIGGDWNNIHKKQLVILHDIVSKIQECVREFRGSFLRFVIDDKGAQCFITFGLKPKIVSNNGMRATLCAIKIHEKVEHLRADFRVSILRKIKLAGKRKNGRIRSIANTLTRKRKDQQLITLVDNIHVAIGITTGKVICGNVGGKSRCEYTLHGECVNYANNVMGHAKSLEIVEIPIKPSWNGAQKSTFKPRIAVGKEVYESTNSHIEYETDNLNVNSHCRKEERLRRNGEDISEKAYVVKGPRLPTFSLALKEATIRFDKVRKLVGRIHERSSLYHEIKNFVHGHSNSLWAVIKGESGMGKTEALGELYNSIKDEYREHHVVIPFFIQSTCIESHSKLFIFRAILLQLAQELNQKKTPHPTDLEQAYEFVDNFVKEKIPKRRNVHDKWLYIIFHPDGSEVTDEIFFKVGNMFTELMKDLLTPSERCIFLFDDWHLMNREVATVIRRTIDMPELSLGTIVTIDSCEDSPFVDVEPIELPPLQDRDFLAMGAKWKTIPVELLKYIREMVRGNPQHGEELLGIIMKAGWVKLNSQKLGRSGCYLSLEAFSCIQDKRLEYRDFVIKEKHLDINDLLFSTGINKSQFLLEKLESTTKSNQTGSSSKDTYDLTDDSGQNFRSLKEKIIQPSAQDKKLNVKFTDYFDKDIYITEEKLTSYLDDTNTIQHMCVKIAAVIGRKFRIKHLAIVLRHLSDDVLEIAGYAPGQNLGMIKAVHGDPELILASLEVALSGLIKKGIFTQEGTVSNGVFDFGTPLLREITLNFMPHYLKQVIYRIITNQIENNIFVREDFCTSLEFNHFVSKFTDAANLVNALGTCYTSIKEIEYYSYYTGDIKFYFESMSRLHAWHSFFIMNKSRPGSTSSQSNSSSKIEVRKLEALNRNKETLSQNALRDFRLWYQTLDRYEVARSLRIGAEKVYWYSTHPSADNGKERRHAQQISQFGVQWVEPLLNQFRYSYEESPTDNPEQLALELELVQLYAIDYRCKRKRKNVPYVHHGLIDIVKTVETKQHQMSLIQQAEFSLPYILTFSSRNYQKAQSYLMKLIKLMRTAYLSDHEEREKRFIVFKTIESINLLLNGLSSNQRYLQAMRNVIVPNGRVPKPVLDLFEPTGNLSDNTKINDLSWRAEKVRYLLNMKAFAREGSQLRAQLVSLAKNFFRREYGKYWAESKKMIVKKDDILLNSLYEFAKVV